MIYLRDRAQNAFNMIQASIERSVELRLVRSPWSAEVRLEGTLARGQRFVVDYFAK